MSDFQSQTPVTTDPVGFRLPQLLLNLWIMQAIGLVLLLTAHWADSDTWTRVAVELVPAGNVVMILLTILRIIRRDSRHLYLPLVAYLFATAVYHGFGPLIFSVGSPEEQMYASTFFPVDMSSLLGVLLLSQTCQVGVLLGYLLWKAALGRWMDRIVRRFPIGNSRLGGMFLVLALWGLGVKFLVQLPVELYLVETRPPGMLLMTGYLTYAAHFYFWHEVAAGRMRLRLPLLLLGVDITFGVVLLAKAFMLLPIAVLLMGYNMAQPLKLRTWVFLVAGGLMTLWLLQPLNTYLRIQRSQGESANILDLAQELPGFLTLDSMQELREMEQTGEIGTSAHSRLSYVDTMAYGINEWNMGRPGDSYKPFRYLFVPRALWPGKPLAEIGVDFTRRVVGHEFSATLITLFGEAYFNLGSLGVVFLCLWLPGLLVLLEVPARLVIERGRFEQVVPLVLGLWVGITVDYYALYVVSLAIFALIAMPLLSQFSRLFQPRTCDL